MDTTQPGQIIEIKPILGLGKVLLRYWLIETVLFSCVFGLTAFTTFQQKPIYEASGDLIFKKNDQTSNLTGVAAGIGQLESVAASSPLNTEVQVIRSTPVVTQTIKALSLSENKESFLAKLDLTVVKGTDVLKVTYKSTNPREAASVVNQLMSSYILNDVQTNRAQTVAARQFINDQLPKVEQDLTKAELALRHFKEENKVFALQEEAKSSIEVVAALDKQITETKSGIASINEISNDLRNRVGIGSEQAVTLSKLSESKAVQDASNELQKIDGQLAIQRTLYQDTHPSVTRLERQKATLQKLLQTRIEQTLGSNATVSSKDLQMGALDRSLVTDLVKAEVERGGAQQRLRTLTDAFEDYKQRLETIPQLEQSQKILERKVEVNRTTYEALLKKLQEVQLAENQTIGNARILSASALPVSPVSPKVNQNLLTGASLGLLLAIAAAIALQSTDTLLRGSDEVKILFGYPLLGILPNLGEKMPNVPSVFVRDNPQSPISEAYRMLQTSLQFLSSDRKIKVIVVTSTIPGEGKSTISSNLAVAMAQRGRRVLLVDADMRRPTQGSIWGMQESEVGLSNVLVGDATLSASIQCTIPNLHVLKTGPIPPNPIALFDSQYMSTLINEWSQIYDHVIFDTPPLLAVTDAMVLGKIADGILLVARPNILNSRSASRAKTLLEQSGIRVLGLVTNDVITEDKNYYMYHYEYLKKA
jgi:polysaccharide biosynthesis transport protein